MKYAVFSILVLLGLLLGMVIITFAERDRVIRYQQYYVSSEALLDSLENEYNWIDGYDSEAIDRYCESRRALY